jgi:hypothetical protein
MCSVNSEDNTLRFHEYGRQRPRASRKIAAHVPYARHAPILAIRGFSHKPDHIVIAQERPRLHSDRLIDRDV